MDRNAPSTSCCDAFSLCLPGLVRLEWLSGRITAFIISLKIGRVRCGIAGLQPAINSNEWMPSLDHSAKAKSGRVSEGVRRGVSPEFVLITIWLDLADINASADRRTELSVQRPGSTI